MAVPATVIYFTCYDQLRDCLRPLELVRTKMQSRKTNGWGPTVLRDVPFSALYWFNYELVKARLHEQQQQHLTNFSISFAAGAISGSVAAILTLPFDVVKTRRQIQLGEMETLGVPLARTSSTWHILKDIWTESGHRGLFAGFLPRVIKVAPACAIMISSYEFGKAFFQEMNLDREQRCS
ncbi:hypothetical protein CRUP_035682 [Coryphaenoides rupestris]|nr:hypothetical protein CRUP_035682 [Coryphaenoides rupestris]